MGITARSVIGKTGYRVIAGLRFGLGRVAESCLLNLRESIAVGMFASNCLPYEASRTCQEIIVEADFRRAQTRLEAQRALAHA